MCQLEHSPIWCMHGDLIFDTHSIVYIWQAFTCSLFQTTLHKNYNMIAQWAHKQIRPKGPNISSFTLILKFTVTVVAKYGLSGVDICEQYDGSVTSDRHPRKNDKARGSFFQFDDNDWMKYRYTCNDRILIGLVLPDYRFLLLRTNDFDSLLKCLLNKNLKAYSWKPQANNPVGTTKYFFFHGKTYFIFRELMNELFEPFDSLRHMFCNR